MICKKKLFLFDIDGVITLGGKLIDGAIELYEKIQQMGGKSVFITNNSTKSIESYINTFLNYGFKSIDRTNFVTSLTITKHYLKNNYNDELIYAWGTQSFVDELQNSLNITTDKQKIDKIKAIIVGYNSELTFQKICDLCEVLQKSNVDYYATNIDLVCPMPFGFVPDCGGICKLIEFATKKYPKFLGKPEPNMVELVLSQNPKFTKSDCVIIGDRLYTDIACGINAGIDSCLVFTGETKTKDLLHTQFNPTYKYNSVKEIYLDLVSQNNNNEL